MAMTPASTTAAAVLSVRVFGRSLVADGNTRRAGWVVLRPASHPRQLFRCRRLLLTHDPFLRSKLRAILAALT
jgi:hypothetical protein